MSTEGWDNEVEGPGAIAQVDQIRQEMLEIIRVAPVVFFIAKLPEQDGASVRSFAFLPATLTAEERHEFMTRFFTHARAELDEMVETLEQGGTE